MDRETTKAREQYALEVGDRLAAAREQAFAELRADNVGPITDYVSAMDATVHEICRWSFAQAAEELGIGWGGKLKGLAVVADGGYGRRRLAPFSDVDLSVVVAEEGDALTDRAVTHAYHVLVDAVRRGLQVEDGYAYYVLDEPFDPDERTLSALLDVRLICGSRDLFDALEERIFRQLDRPLFLRWNYDTRQAARRNAGGVIHVQEPNIKESPGGLRDLQCALWSAAAVWRRRPAEMLDQLVELGELAPEQAAAARRAQDFLWAIRSWLHLSAGRKRDVLALDAQIPAASALGFTDDAGDARPNALMAAYYEAAETLEQVSRQVFGLCEAARVSVGHGFYVHERALWTRNAPRLRNSAALAMRALELAQRYDLGLSRRLATSLEAAGPAVRLQDASPEAAGSFLRILRAGPRAVRILRLAQETGLLQAYIPEFGLAMRWSSGEPVHEYTVGEHLLRTLERLVPLTDGEAEEFEHHAEIYSEAGKPEVLVLAALLHDVGRIDPSRDHCEVGEEIARRTAHRLGMPESDVRAVSRLVRRHLLLDRVATLRDISDEATIHHVAEQVGTVDFLKRLYLLTCADMMAVGAGLWTDVRRDQLEDLYFRVLMHLLADAPARAARENLSRLRERAMATLLRSRKLPAAEVKRHCRLMPDAYFLGTATGMIGVHISLTERLEKEETVTDFYNDANSQYTELTVCRYDDAQPGLFAKLCAALYANDVDIHDARIYTRGGERPVALDTLWVTWDNKQVPEAKASAIQTDLRDVLDGDTDPEGLLVRKQRPRPASLQIVRLKARNDLSKTHTVFEVAGRDQLGFLFCVSAALSSLGLNIHTSKITTRGRMAEDAFYVTDAQGSKLRDDEAGMAEDALLRLLTNDFQ
jgi:[protein-PII] uridylyltransferase